MSYQRTLVVGVFACGVPWRHCGQAMEVRFDYSVLAMRDAQSPAMRALLELQQDRPNHRLQRACTGQ
jgi:hypothetical protein